MRVTQPIAELSRARSIALLVLVCSCSRESQIQGRYSAQNGSAFDLELKDGNKANMISALGGGTVEFDYEVDGKEVKLKTPMGTMIATITDDGCLSLGSAQPPLCKQKVAKTGLLKRIVARAPRLEGRYTNSQGLLDLQFKDNNKVNQITPFGTTEIDYAVEGKEVKLMAPTGTMVGTIGDDGCLNFGGLFGAICKTKNQVSDGPSTAASLPSAATAAQLAAERGLHASAVMPAGYLEEMPTAQRVLADFNGADPVETRARRYSATKFLEHALAVLVHDHQFNMSAAERVLYQDYGKARSELYAGSADVPGLTAKIDSLCCGRPAEVAFRRDMLKHYFTPAWQTAFLRREQAVGESD